MISTFVHGILDYIWSALLIAGPWLFGYNRVGIETYITDTIAAIVLTYSMFTRYELSFFKNISTRTHLWFDLALGAFLTASPWLFGFSDKVYLPHVVFGIFSIVVSLLTKRESTIEEAEINNTDTDRVIFLK
jgi:hypothetical protein